MGNGIAPDEPVVWFSEADGSWGGCLRGDLFIVPVAYFTDAESAAFESARYEYEQVGIVREAATRYNAERGRS